MNRVAIVLAAGAARRFGGDKLAAPFQGEPLVHHAIRAARAAPVNRVIVVAKPGLDVGEWHGEPTVRRVELASDALSDSLKTGIANAQGAESAFIFLGDMPLIPHGLAARLANAIGDAFAALPRQNGQPGHPVLLSARAFPDIARLTGDEGAGKLLRARKDIACLDMADQHILLDIDRPQDLSELQKFAPD